MASHDQPKTEGYEPCNILWSDEPWKGRVLFTGPNDNSDHRVTVEPEHRYVGQDTMSPEGTSEVDYLWRPAPQTPFHNPKTCKVGEVGWGIPQKQDWSAANTDRQIMLGHFRQEMEDRHSHLYQNPWYPGPEDQLHPASDAALVMNVWRNSSAAGGARDQSGNAGQSGSAGAPGDRTSRHLHSEQ